MSDQRKKSIDLRASKWDRADAVEKSPAKTNSPRTNREATIQTVSTLLASRKDVLQSVSARPAVVLPELSKAREALTQRPKETWNTPAAPEAVKTTLESPSLKLPGPAEADRPLVDHSPSNEDVPVHRSVTNPSVIDTAHGTVPTIARLDSENAIASHPSGGTKQAPPDVPDRTTRDEVPAAALSLPISRSIEPSRSMDDFHANEASVARDFSCEAGPPADRIELGSARIDSRSVDSAVGSSVRDRFVAADAPPLVTSSRHLDESSGRETNAPVRPDYPLNSARSFGLSAESVRNPLSCDLRNSLMDLPGGTGESGIAPETTTPAFGMAEGADGPSASTSESGAIDLSKTNELLQQLLDAVRKQRSSSLPVGGPSVYADR